MHSMSQRDQPDPSADEDQTQASEAQVNFRRRQEMDDLKWLMGNAAGRRLAARVLDQTGVRRSTFNTSGSIMAFNEGQRNIGIWFESELIEADAGGYFKMLREYKR